MQLGSGLTFPWKYGMRNLLIENESNLTTFDLEKLAGSLEPPC